MSHSEVVQVLKDCSRGQVAVSPKNLFFRRNRRREKAESLGPDSQTLHFLLILRMGPIKAHLHVSPISH
jgi:hypothetical protein